MKEKSFSKNFWFMIIGICLLLVIFVIIGFVAFANREEEIIENEENGGSVVLNYSNNFCGLSLLNIVPTTDSLAKKSIKEGEFFDFSVMTTLDNATEINYEIVLVKNIKKSTIKNEDIKVYLEQEKSGTYTSVFEPTIFTPIKKSTDLGSPVGSMILSTVNRKKTVDDKYRLRVWLSDTSLLESGNVEVEVQVFGQAS